MLIGAPQAPTPRAPWIASEDAEERIRVVGPVLVNGASGAAVDADAAACEGRESWRCRPHGCRAASSRLRLSLGDDLPVSRLISEGHRGGHLRNLLILYDQSDVKGDFPPSV